MVWVALLRGINVGGKNKVPMKQLAAAFERAGMTHVRTYINSGNVVFRSGENDPAAVGAALEAEIEAEIGFVPMLLVREGATIVAIAEALPAGWANDDVSKCDVMYLSREMDDPSALEHVTIKPDTDEVMYVPGAILWRVDRKLVGRSGLLKVMGTPLYKQITVRNCNTARKLAELVAEADG